MGIMSLFIKVEDDNKGKEEAKPSSQQKSTPIVSIPVSPISTVGQEDIEIKKQLIGALEKANQPGYDYFEFAQSVDNLASTLPSEELRFKTAFTVVSATGVTAGTLLSSADFYLGILKKKEDEFNSAMVKHSNDSVVAKENSLQTMDTQMQEKTELIKKLTTEINELQQKKLTTMNEVTQAKAEIEKVKNNFAVTLKVFMTRISGDIEKIKSYLSK